MKNRNVALAFVLGSALLFTACAAAGEKEPGSVAGKKEATQSDHQEEAGSAYHKISAEEAKERMEQGRVTIVDVRTEEEYQESHIPGAILASNESIEEEASEILPDKDAVLLVYCRSGNRSRQASEKLIGMGYRKVYDFGGITDWPYETESGEAAQGKPVSRESR